MAKILRMKDRIRVKIGDIEFLMAPLSYLHKQEIANCTRNSGGKEIYDFLKAQALHIKYGLKGVKGLKTYDDKDYELQFDGDCLSDECLNEILAIECNDKLSAAAWSILNGYDQEAISNNEKALEGIDIEVVSEGKLKAAQE